MPVVPAARRSLHGDSARTRAPSSANGLPCRTSSVSAASVPSVRRRIDADPTVVEEHHRFERVAEAGVAEERTALG